MRNGASNGPGGHARGEKGLGGKKQKDLKNDVTVGGQNELLVEEKAERRVLYHREGGELYDADPGEKDRGTWKPP